MAFSYSPDPQPSQSAADADAHHGKVGGRATRHTRHTRRPSSIGRARPFSSAACWVCWVGPRFAVPGCREEPPLRADGAHGARGVHHALPRRAQLPLVQPRRFSRVGINPPGLRDCARRRAARFAATPHVTQCGALTCGADSCVRRCRTSTTQEADGRRNTRSRWSTSTQPPKLFTLRARPGSLRERRMRRASRRGAAQRADVCGARDRAAPRHPKTPSASARARGAAAARPGGVGGAELHERRSAGRSVP